jgi:hypothetical protein
MPVPLRFRPVSRASTKRNDGTPRDHRPRPRSTAPPHGGRGDRTQVRNPLVRGVRTVATVAARRAPAPVPTHHRVDAGPRTRGRRPPIPAAGPRPGPRPVAATRLRPRRAGDPSRRREPRRARRRRPTADQLSIRPVDGRGDARRAQRRTGGPRARDRHRHRLQCGSTRAPARRRPRDHRGPDRTCRCRPGATAHSGGSGAAPSMWERATSCPTWPSRQWTARPRRPPAEPRPGRWSSSASCLPSASPAACAYG